MKCNKVQELLLSDYLDGELNLSLVKEIEQHVLGCKKCRVFNEAVRAQVVAPFKKAEEPVTPAHVWDNIAKAIDEQGRFALRLTIRDHIRDFFDSIVAPFRLKGPVMAFASTVIVALMILVFVYQPTVHDPYLGQIVGEQMDFLTSLSTNGLEEDETLGVELDTTIEYFFL